MSCFICDNSNTFTRMKQKTKYIIPVELCLECYLATGVNSDGDCKEYPASYPTDSDICKASKELQDTCGCYDNCKECLIINRLIFIRLMKLRKLG